jgi:hypothetical protein
MGSIVYFGFEKNEVKWVQPDDIQHGGLEIIKTLVENKPNEEE